jgi:hypothetical protein
MATNVEILRIGIVQTERTWTYIAEQDYMSVPVHFDFRYDTTLFYM